MMFSYIYPVADRLGDDAVQLQRHIQDCWWFVSYMLGMNVGWNMYSNRSSYKHSLLVSDLGETFITADQSIINIHPNTKYDVVKVASDEECDFFFPLSPRVAYLISKSERFPHGVSAVSEDFVKDVNQRISLAALSQLSLKIIFITLIC